MVHQKVLFVYLKERNDKANGDGGGPKELHTHTHNHLFIVVKGEAKIVLSDDVIIVHENESYLVNGSIPHSVWNNIDETTVMIGVSVK